MLYIRNKIGFITPFISSRENKARSETIIAKSIIKSKNNEVNNNLINIDDNKEKENKKESFNMIEDNIYTQKVSIY